MYRRKEGKGEGERLSGTMFHNGVKTCAGQPATSTGLDSISKTVTDKHKHSKTQAFPQLPRLDSERVRARERARERERERESYVSLSPPRKLPRPTQTL
jgi:hypothetical protein